MKKYIFITLLLSLSSVAHTDAQVTIGSHNNPYTSALLDLQSNSMGLMLPRVTLKENPEWWALDFDGASDTIAVKAAAGGMIVFNTADVLDGPGLYVWNGVKWSTMGCQKPKQPGVITFDPALPGMLALDMPLKISVAPIAGADSYQWTITGDDFSPLTQTTTEPKCEISRSTLGTNIAITVSVKALNDCGESTPATGSGEVDVIESLAPYLISGCTSFMFNYQEMPLSLLLDGLGVTPTSYQWYCDGILISDETEADFLLSFPSVGRHEYTCVYSNGVESKSTPAKVIQVYQGAHEELYPIVLDTNDGGTIKVAHVSLGAENYINPCDMKPAYYQWGRSKDGHEVYNSNLTSTKADDITATTPSSVVGKFITTELESWTNGTLPATWTNAVCPAGWHVMTLAEAKSLLPLGERSANYSDAGIPNNVIFTDAVNPTEGDYFTIQPKSNKRKVPLLILNQGFRNTNGSYGDVSRWWIADMGANGYMTLDWNTLTGTTESIGFIGSGNSSTPTTESVVIQSSMALGGQEVRCVKN